jgi:RHS repeat-associated protein
MVRGQLTKTVRYEGTYQYATETLGYNSIYQPTSVKYTIPSSPTAAGVSGAYTYVYSYHPDGSLATTRVPAGGSGPGMETLTYGYNTLGMPTTLSTSLGGTYVVHTNYTSLNELAAVDLQHNNGYHANLNWYYETDTRRTNRVLTSKQRSPTSVADSTYTYDDAGNVTKISEAGSSDHQCFTYDSAQRLVEAWTPRTGNCTVAASASELGGPAKYWHSYTYDASGGRATQVQHATATGDRTIRYAMAAGTHRLGTLTVSDQSGSYTNGYTYDSAGNTVTRPATPSQTQRLDWDAEGRLSSSADATGMTKFVYNADGERLIRKDPVGTTLYLPGQEIRHTPATGTFVTRYYTHAGRTVATRTATGVTWLNSDRNGTPEISITATAQDVATRRLTPFGESRGSSGSWPGTLDKGFLGATQDNTGLTHIGAREYDPVTGRFVSPDPVLSPADPQQHNGYSYANNSPVTFSDPTGLLPQRCPDGECRFGGYSRGTSPATRFGSTHHYLRNNDGVRCPDGAKTCRAVPGMSRQLQRQRQEAAAQRALQAARAARATPAPPRFAQFGLNMTAAAASRACPVCRLYLKAVDAAAGAAGVHARVDQDSPEFALTATAADAVNSAALKRLGVPPRAGDALGNLQRLADKMMFCSFTARTRVLMADGSTKPISEIRFGDKVKASSPAGVSSTARPVTATWVHRDTVVRLVVAGSVIETTADHPFWNASLRRWQSVDQLRPGDMLLNANGGLVAVERIEPPSRQPEAAYNLTVDGLHTYYVLAGDTPVLVHNDGDEYVTPGNNSYVTVDEALDAGLKWLGDDGYTEPVPGSGRYVSRDGTRVFRMGDSDILGKHGGGPHTNFERLAVDPKTGRMKVVQNDHVYFKEGSC